MSGLVQPFLSTVPGSLDSKGRVCIPATHRHLLVAQNTTGVYVCPSFIDPALDAFGQDLLDRITARLAGQDAFFSASFDDEATALIARPQWGSVMSAHVPVMLAEVLEALSPRDGAHYVDGTFGGGGYASAILEAADCRVLGIDRDPAAIARGQALVERFGGRLTLVQGEFSRMKEFTRESDGVVLDLGVSSFQFDEPARGFSFREDGPLDMRMGLSGESAADVVNSADERTLAQIIARYGEEKN